MQIDLPFSTPPEEVSGFRVDWPEPSRGQVGDASDRVDFVRVRRARRYVMRVRPDGTLRVTIPRGGSRAEAIAFMERHASWITRERARVRTERAPVVWTHGSTVLLRGLPQSIDVWHDGSAFVAGYADRIVPIESPANVRGEIEQDLRQLAAGQLVPRLKELADQHGLQFTRVSIRNQRSRWGSCARSGAIALNFRLVQMPPDVCDYVLIHELMHLRQQNHGRRFWTLVERACPDYRAAERWLRQDGRGLF